MAIRRYRILIVDDDYFVCTMLGKMLSKESDYAISLASSGEEAIASISKTLPDLVVSDISMPGMDGFELFYKLSQQYPSIKRVLITGYDIDSYFDMIRQHNIGNILIKNADLSTQYLGTYIRSLLTGDIFGLGRYFANDPGYCSLIRTYSQSEAVCKTIADAYTGTDQMLFQISVNELISNAMFHGALKLTNTPRELWNDDFEIPQDQAVRVCWILDDEKLGVAVTDLSGALHKEDVLKWLDHPIGDNDPDGEHGRGFMLVRRFIDRFIVNIDPGKKTECILMQYFDRERTPQKKPLLIHEL